MAIFSTARRQRQRGLTFIGLVLLVALAVAIFAIGGQSLPILMEYQAITKAANKAAAEGGTVQEVRAIFDRAASIDNITSIKGTDLDVGKNNDRVTVGFNYSREIPLVGPAYLLYRFKR
jgi:hypothetical protein